MLGFIYFMPKISERSKITELLDSLDQGLQDYFGLLVELLDKVSSSEPALAYCFQRIEMAQRVGLYALLMREYRTNSEMAWAAVDALQIDRSSFGEHFKRISGKQLPDSLRTKIKPAELVRDRIMHGRSESRAQIHRAIFQCLEYAQLINRQFQTKVGFKPFGQLRGVTSNKARAQLDEKISRAVLGGLKLL